ncbi:esterase family protein [Halobacillus litoralis]|uniref:alpha/beta hydrolase n=1 Tax=Halobacillus litoralis TaxID=45668 RepID=UPI001CD46606|nr:alpha/beta hydrolase family protein [Halobacillus litoralis]MCA0972077.1 esterase family protein [Halobacillus litoralis]
MALLTCRVFSNVLDLHTSIEVVLPDQETEPPFPVLYLLHGYSDDETAWTRQTSIERYAKEKGLAVVMPRMDHSYYADMEYGKKYWTFLSEELPAIVHAYFPLTKKREETFVAGLSMGGYGALKWALNKPAQFAAVASLSGVTDLSGYVKEVRQTGSDKFAHIFGDRELAGTMDDPLWLLERVDASNGAKPAIYQSCGTEDFLFHHNFTFKEKCEQTSLDFTYEFDAGDHEWNYWDRHILKVLDWLPLNK